MASVDNPKPIHVYLTRKGTHRNILRQGATIQCLDCGHWSAQHPTQNLMILDSVACEETTDDVPTAELEVRWPTSD